MSSLQLDGICSFLTVALPGEINRSDVALATVAAALAGPQTDDVTFEVYAAKNKYPLQFGFPNKSGFEHTGPGWPQVFDGLKTDTQLAAAIKSSK
jgi:hypothetical protein